jgi:hypothetical protein
MKRVGLAAALAVLALSIAGSGAAQGGMPSLTDTLRFIRDKIADEGPVEYVALLHDAVDGRTWTNRFSAAASDVAYDAEKCRVSFHWRSTNNGEVSHDGDTWIDFGTVRSVDVVPMDEDLDNSNARAGHPSWRAEVDPAVWVVVARQAGGGASVLDFRDRAMAERVANASLHAAHLCGGARREPF